MNMRLCCFTLFLFLLSLKVKPGNTRPGVSGICPFYDALCAQNGSGTLNEICKGCIALHGLIEVVETAVQDGRRGERSGAKTNVGTDNADTVKDSYEVTYNNGSKYTGELKNNKRFGNGTFMYVNGSTYTGQWRYNRRAGYGTMKYSNTSFYTGQWRRNVRSGYGTMVYAPRKQYTGNWVQDIKEGFGRMTFPDGSEYEGSWSNDLQHGFGKLTQAIGTSIEGLWVRGEPTDITEDVEGVVCFQLTKDNQTRRFISTPINRKQLNGTGKCTYKDGTTYDGTFNYGAKSGEGTYVYTDGAVYTGGWKENMRSGIGRIEYLNGSSYNGTWINDYKHEFGWEVSFDGKRYIGEYEFDKKTGLGAKFWPGNKKTFHGIFSNNNRLKGIILKNTGEILFGSYRDDQLDGKGFRIFDDSDDMQCVGWSKGFITQRFRQCFEDPEKVLEFVDRDNGRYNGEVKRVNGRRIKHGYGELFSTDFTYKGKWTDDKMDGFGYLAETIGPTYIGQFKKGLKEGSGLEISKSIKYRTSYIGGWRNNKKEGVGRFIYPNSENYIGIFKQNKKIGTGVFTTERGEEVDFVNPYF